MVVCLELLFWNLLKCVLVSKKAIVITMLLSKQLEKILFPSLTDEIVTKGCYYLEEEEGQDPDRITKWKFNRSLCFTSVSSFHSMLYGICLQMWESVFLQPKLLMQWKISKKYILKRIMAIYYWLYKWTNW